MCANHAQKPMILDPTSEGEKVLEYLGELINKLENLQEKAFQYKTHQKNFKVPCNSITIVFMLQFFS